MNKEMLAQEGGNGFRAREIKSDVLTDSVENFAHKATEKGANLVYCWPGERKDGDDTVIYTEISAQKNGTIVSVFRAVDETRHNGDSQDIHVNEETSRRVSRADIHSNEVKKLLPGEVKIITPATLAREHAQKKPRASKKF